MKRVISVKENGASQAMGSLESAYRRWFSRGLAVALILVGLFITPSSNLLYGQESEDALFIDKDGNVGIGNTTPKASLDVKGNAIISGNVAIGLGDRKVTAVSGSIKAISFDGFGTVPIGGIIMWSGTTIPPGWSLCDGSNRTPDLSGRFVLSSGGAKGHAPRKIGERGGEEKHTLTIAEMPSHNHKWKARPFHDEYGRGGAEWHWERAIAAPKDYNSNVIGYEGGGKPHNNMPPFYVLAFIMRVQ